MTFLSKTLAAAALPFALMTATANAQSFEHNGETITMTADEAAKGICGTVIMTKSDLTNDSIPTFEPRLVENYQIERDGDKITVPAAAYIGVQYNIEFSTNVNRPAPLDVFNKKALTDWTTISGTITITPEILVNMSTEFDENHPEITHAESSEFGVTTAPTSTNSSAFYRAEVVGL